jgi:hypothetical protein
VSLDLFWLRDESLEDSNNLPDPHILAHEIADDLARHWRRSRTCSGIWSNGRAPVRRGSIELFAVEITTATRPPCLTIGVRYKRIQSLRQSLCFIG